MAVVGKALQVLDTGDACGSDDELLTGELGEEGEEEASSVATALAADAAGRVVIAAGALDVDARQDKVVNSEGLAWRRARSAWIIAGIGAAVMLQGRIRALFQRSRAVLDIEDLSEVTNFCKTCDFRSDGPLSTGRARAITTGDARAEGRPRCLLLRERSKQRPDGVGACGKDHCRFAGCALCSESGPLQGPCAACDYGLKMVCKNTFLTLDEEDERQEGARRRCKSL